MRSVDMTNLRASRLNLSFAGCPTSRAACAENTLRTGYR
ncbi:hypothetical protein EPIR_1222 [Erwinia piriflorinigrans CFBP 5888]|uniref:Uncharacterized protein n=1 Tax=Erwinia piriflorinigrans CFBP 5888 TaxID=1161919 RepID=V5Z6P1_9GAMM|nr:hypothetical protein EPIR_1222 [Erwinia piriflorinigrans CFBP 5888]